jgi:hypothetical protein
MHTIELNEAEMRVLKTTLQSFISDLGVEIAGTDRKDYRDEIKQKRDALEHVLEKLD